MALQGKAKILQMARDAIKAKWPTIQKKSKARLAEEVATVMIVKCVSADEAVEYVSTKGA